MKKIVVGAFLLLPAFSYCQEASSAKKVSGFEMQQYGYIDSVRLDSIDSKFLVLETTEFSVSHNIDRYDIDYGQARDKYTATVIKDGRGQSMKYNGVASLLNFFYYNGWQLKETISSSAFGRTIEMIFERKAR